MQNFLPVPDLVKRMIELMRPAVPFMAPETLAMLEKALVALWWDGFFRGLVCGLIITSVLALVLEALRKRGSS